MTNTSPTDHAKSAAQDVAQAAQAKAKAAATHAQHDLAARAQQQADQVSEAAGAFDANPYAQEAAAKVSATLSQVADAVRDADFATVHADVTRFARRNPALFFGGAMALGFVAARALKASERPHNGTDHTPRPMDQDVRRWGDA
ncbi:MAG: hypothetical protein AAF092_09490 [Pseudomonadota bacterium]